MARAAVTRDVLAAGERIEYNDFSLSFIASEAVLTVNRPVRALLSLSALLSLLGVAWVPALHAAAHGTAPTAVDAPREGRDDTPAPRPHDHQGCASCHAGLGTPTPPDAPALEPPLRLVAIAHAPRTSAVPASEPSLSLPPSRAPPRP
jgi:hypothetical protein